MEYTFNLKFYFIIYSSNIKREIMALDTAVKKNEP